MYFRSQVSVCLLTACLAACITCHLKSALGDEPRSTTIQPPEWETRIEAALDREGEWAFEDVPLIELCALIQDKLLIDVVLDTNALEDFGIDSDTKITRSIKGISNQSFLRLVLRDLDLTYTMRSGALWITNSEEAESQLTTKVYPVGDLLRHRFLSDDASTDYDLLMSAITSSTAVKSWGIVGGPATIGGFHESLVVSQTLEEHAQIEQLLTTYRDLIATEDETGDQKQMVSLLGQRLNQAIYDALDRSLTAEFKEMPLNDAANSISEIMGIPVVTDIDALEDFGIDRATPVRGKFTKTPLRFALARLLSELELTYTIRDEVLLITTPEEAETHLTTGLYPVRALVERGDGESDDPPRATDVDFDSLSEVIRSTIAPDTWDKVGGSAAIEPLLPAPTLVISQTCAVHDQIVELLTKLRLARAVKAERVVTGSDATLVRSYPLVLSNCTSDEIAKLVMRDTETGTWNGQDGTFVEGLGSTLVVKHTHSVQYRVQKLLSQLGVWFPIRNDKQWCPAVSDGGGRF